MNTVEMANGRWRDLLGRFGVQASHLSGRHGPCPMCGGKDRFRFDNKNGRGTWFCNQCGAGDGFILLERLKGWDFQKACNEVEEIMGDTVKEPETKTDDAGARKAMADRWSKAKRLTIGDEAMAYLESRGIKLMPDQIRDVRCGRGEMLALYRDMDGVGRQLHRTIFDPKRKLFCRGTIPLGGAVRLMEHGKVLGIAEGIENALSASIFYKEPCWAALNANLLEKWQPPVGVKRVLVFGDRDSCQSGFAGQAAAYSLARRLSKDYAVEVLIPALEKDWNDFLRFSAPARA